MKYTIIIDRRKEEYINTDRLKDQLTDRQVDTYIH